ncbi:transmembrane protein 106B-like [Corticium candelabrum]|uniref:transmembrane protein 106B-like n=1 Tax=Corticium candelabrum TaxID=121492 RepID=UPI002E258739|nr:transmembrane protein 106B-like [Corticium candelabrum]
MGRGISRPVVARPVDYNIPPENSLDSTRGGRSLCPTCNGIGYVSTQNTELTALIPYKDERLKPRRTKLYVMLTVTVSAILSGLLLFLLLPRSVSVKLTKPSLIGYSEVGNDSVIVDVNFTLSIINDNFLPITVGSVEITASETAVHLGRICNISDASISMRSTKEFVYVMSLKFRGEQGLSMRKLCAGEDWTNHKLNIVFQEYVQYTFLTSSEKLENDSYYLLNCIKPGTPAPP